MQRQTSNEEINSREFLLVKQRDSSRAASPLLRGGEAEISTGGHTSIETHVKRLNERKVVISILNIEVKRKTRLAIKVTIFTGSD